MIKILLSIYLLLSSFVLFAQGLFENDPIWRDVFITIEQPKLIRNIRV